MLRPYKTPMDLILFLKGFGLGFSIAAPVGPIGLLCIKRTLNEGRAAGLLSGLGAATADAVYGCIAGFGLTLISNFLVEQKFWLGLAGGLFLGYLGIKTFLSQPATQTTQTDRTSLFGNYVSTLFLTLTNPLTILSFVGIFVGLGLAATSQSYQAALWLVGGVFVGSAAWWLILSFGVSLFRGAFDTRRLGWLNQLSGLVIMAFAVMALFNAR
jgi:threonine/homoserine/homoserine lactone efflux protein